MNKPKGIWRTLHYAAKEPDPTPNAIGEIIENFGARAKFTASLQYASGRDTDATQGARLPYTQELYGINTPLEEGMGVWVDTSIEDDPDYEVIAVMRMAQFGRATIRKRGVAGG